MTSPYPVTFHNVTELESATAGHSGVTLRRFPRAVRFDPALSLVARHFTAHSSNGCEIRFVAPHPIVRIHLASNGCPGRIFVLCGDYPYKTGFMTLETGRVTTLHLEHPGFDNRESAIFSRNRFSNQVWRIYCLDIAVTLCGIDGGNLPVRPPTVAEQPARRWLAYGSSITQCGEDYQGYLNSAAELLGVDALNLGMGGSCFLEASVADFIAGRNDWDFATLELGINVLGQMTVEEFESRARHLVRTIQQAHPTKPLFLITTFRNGLDHATKSDPVWVEPCLRHREILRQIVAETASPTLHLIDGLAVFPNFTGFQADLLHPGPLACCLAGERLASLLRPKLGALLP